MIPDRVVEMLHGPSYLQIGTRDADLRPAHTFAVGALVHEDRETVTVFVPTARAQRIMADLESNGRVALGIAQVSHEAYQLDGAYGDSYKNADAVVSSIQARATSPGRKRTGRRCSRTPSASAIPRRSRGR